MKLAVLADLHIGFRRYPSAVNADGRNQREADVSAVVFEAVGGIVAAAPDLVLIPGDVFHTPQPGNLAMRDAVEAVQRLRKVAPVIIVMGNHDKQRTEEGGVGSPLAVLAKVGAKVVMRAEYVSIPSLRCHVLAVPDRDIRRVKLEPSKDEGTQLLCAHGTIGGRLANIPGIDVLDPSCISQEFSFAALGDLHGYQQVAPNAWYPGSLEFVSSDPWREAGKPKGWLSVDTDAGTVELQPVRPRPHFDLPLVDANGLTGAQITEQILANIAAIESAGAVVRQVVIDCHRATKSAIDYKAIKAATGSMLAWRPDIRRPDDVAHAGILLSLPEAPDWVEELNQDEPVEQYDPISDEQFEAMMDQATADGDAFLDSIAAEVDRLFPPAPRRCPWCGEPATSWRTVEELYDDHGFIATDVCEQCAAPAMERAA